MRRQSGSGCRSWCHRCWWQQGQKGRTAPSLTALAHRGEQGAAEAECPLASSLLHLHSLRPSANALLTGVCHQPPEGAGLCPVPSSRAVPAFLQMLVTCLLEAHGCAWHWALTSEAQNRTVRGHDL